MITWGGLKRLMDRQGVKDHELIQSIDIRPETKLKWVTIKRKSGTKIKPMQVFQ